MNSTPRITVRIRPILVDLRSPCCRAWWAQVTVQPESSRVRVLTSGRRQASTVSMPLGGQVCQAAATSSTGERVRTWWNRAISKKIQNHATKNITSEAMNMIMP